MVFAQGGGGQQGARMHLMADMPTRHAQPGRVDWTGLRPERCTAAVSRTQAQIEMAGLDGDRARAGRRAVALIQAEHLPVIAGLLGGSEVVPEVKPGALWRTLLIWGINLGALKGRQIAVGDAVLRLTVI